MSKITKSGHDFVGYEYKELTVARDKFSFYLDAYQNFGWEMNESLPEHGHGSNMILTLRRDRRIVNKAELTRLQKNFEACAGDIKALESAKTSSATILALTTALAGTAFMAGSVFAVSAQSPNIPLCVLLAIPAFLCWGGAWFLYRWRSRKKIQQLSPLIEEKYEEIYSLCERGHLLLPPGLGLLQLYFMMVTCINKKVTLK